ncbi:hypothetical protein E4L96_08660 [Massilia arenosa]|uniref:Uncharacterized protein n=1 Tax=Zemynaea arenosa TaxID=2561931 RepID=A0A4Y9SK80_9BURK|nr:hypothetical protein [Massilia arenosa]TFW21668.1 hypothetical protein E4L96_08660 [Massilia arenosa]
MASQAKQLYQPLRDMSAQRCVNIVEDLLEIGDANPASGQVAEAVAVMIEALRNAVHDPEVAEAVDAYLHTPAVAERVGAAKARAVHA